MTEIPEHLLKRSKERRAAMGLGEEGSSASGATDAPAQGAGDAAVEKPAVAPAVASSAAPVAAAAPPPAPPDPPYVRAAKTRKKVPMWAAPVLAALPLWGFIYFQSLQEPPAGANDPLALGAEVYSGKGGCAGCHGADGGGGVGPKLSDGEVLKTFKNPLGMVHWIAFGADGGARDNGTYGDLDRPGGPENTATLPSAMPAQKDKLDSEELAAVSMYVRETLSGGKPEPGFSVADFPTLGPIVDEVVALGPGGDPKVPGGTGTKAAGEGTSGDSTDAAGGSSGAGSTGGTSGTRGADSNSSGGSGPESGNTADPNATNDSGSGADGSGTTGTGSGDSVSNGSGSGGTPAGGG